jgi:glycerophosphoryl diester phosphodiesterase
MNNSIVFALAALVLSSGAAVVAQPTLDLQAHRGGRGLMPENSIPAMLHGVELGARTLELDCVISADGKVVVSHDVFMSSDIMLKPDGSAIEKSEEKQYALYKMTYDSIRRFPEGVKPHPKFPEQASVRTYKPLLGDLIDSVEAYVAAHHLKPVYYNMETKSSPDGDDLYHPKPERFVALVMAVVKSRGIGGRVTIQSFDPRTLQALHKTDPGQTTALLVENTEGFAKNIDRLGFSPSIYSPNYLLVNADLVKEAHAHHVAVLPWTVNKEADLKAMAALGVDGIISDYPDRLVKLFGSYQKP